MKRGKTEVETLRLNGWGPGDILEGDEGHGPDQIKIIAMANECFICQWKSRETGYFERESPNTTLSCREWEKVGHDPDYGIAPGIGLRKAKQLGTVCGVLIETEDGKRAAIHELGRVQWIENIDTGDIAEHSGNDDAIDWRAVADSAISDIVEVAGILGGGERRSTSTDHRPCPRIQSQHRD